MAALSQEEAEDLAAGAKDAGHRADFQKMRENSEASASQATFEDHLLWLGQVNAGLGHPKRETRPIVGREWVL